MTTGMKRRQFMALLGGATAASPLAAGAQAAMPVVGLLSSVAFESRPDQIAAFHRGLNESGFVEGKNVKVEYRSADNHIERLPALAADLVSRGVAVIITIGGDISAQAAKTATVTIPIVIVIGGDPVERGYVASLNRPDGNLTGVSFLVNLLVTKRLELLNELMPRGTKVGVLVNPINPNTEPSLRELRTAAQTLGRELFVAWAGAERDIDLAFAAFAREKVGAVLVEADPFFLARKEQVVALAAMHALPTIYSFSEFAAAGGLMSYGTSLADAYRQAGVYGARILKGEKPADLPVIQPTKFELVLNLKTARALGLDIPPTLLARAHEVLD